MQVSPCVLIEIRCLYVPERVAFPEMKISGLLMMNTVDLKKMQGIFPENGNISF